jgi:hypothetical protein
VSHPPGRLRAVENTDDAACWVQVGGEPWPGLASRWRRDPEGWRAFVSYSRREPEGLLRYMHWMSAADLTPRDEDTDHPAWASSAGGGPQA